MLDLLLLPFQLAWDLICAAFSIFWGLVSLVFGLLGGLVELAMSIAVIVLLGALVRIAVQRRTAYKTHNRSQHEDFRSFYDQDGKVE